MAAFALSWNRSPWWADRLHKPAGRAVSDYHSADYGGVEKVAAHINSLDPDMGCKVEVFK